MRSPRTPRWAGGLLGLLAICELGWYGFSLLQVAPAERFLGDDPVGTALIRLDGEFASIGPDSHQGSRLVLRRSSAAVARRRKDKYQRRLSARSRRAALSAPLSRRVVPASQIGRADAGSRRRIQETNPPGRIRPDECRLSRFRPVRIRPGMADGCSKGPPVNPAGSSSATRRRCRALTWFRRPPSLPRERL